jgi:FlaA1/EpsC-like NDP-sugar epimerase
MNIFKNKNILITGGTGSLGQALTCRLLDESVDRIVIYSRDEYKQSIMEKKFNDKRLRFFLGDIRDYGRTHRAMEDIDYVFHLAALKQVPKAEYDPDEFIKTNVKGTRNVLVSARERNIEKLIFTSTDKANLATTMYGKTKSLAEGLTTTMNFHKGHHRTIFSTVRYGNVVGSRHSLIDILTEQLKKMKPLTITDMSMTRFNITLKQSVDFILKAFLFAKGGEIFVPKLKAYSVIDFINAFIATYAPDKAIDVNLVGIRGMEKIHEVLINEDEKRDTYEIDDMYMILPSIHLRERFDLDYNEKNLKKVSFSEYTSDNVELMSKDELKSLMRKFKNKAKKICKRDD